MNSPPYANSTWAIKVTDAASGEALVDYNASALVEPASVTKTFSVGAGWLKFGPDSRITTLVVHTGTVDAGTLTGDLVLVAKGDILMGGQTGRTDAWCSPTSTTTTPTTSPARPSPTTTRWPAWTHWRLR